MVGTEKSDDGLGRKWQWPNLSTAAAVTWRDSGKLRLATARRVRVRPVIPTEQLQNRSREGYCYASPLRLQGLQYTAAGSQTSHVDFRDILKQHKVADVIRAGSCVAAVKVCHWVRNCWLCLKCLNWFECSEPHDTNFIDERNGIFVGCESQHFP